MENQEKGRNKKFKLPNKHFYKWFIPNFVKKGVVTTLIASLMIFGIYLFGSMLNPGFTDGALFFLLDLLYYTSLILLVLSLFALGLRIHLLVYNPGARAVLGLFTYFFSGVLGAFLAMLSSLIEAISSGYS